MGKQSYLGRILGVLFALLLCSDAGGATAESPGVGILLPLSGQFAPIGDIARRSITAVATPQLRLYFEDEQCSPKHGLSAYRKLSAIEQVKFFIGPACGAPQKVVAAATTGREELFLLPSAAPRDLYKLSGGRMLAVQYAMEDESAFLAETIYQRGHQRVALLYSENEYGTIHASAFRREFKGKVLRTLSYLENDPAQLRLLALQLKRLNPDAIYLPDLSPFFHGIMKELRKLQWMPPVFSVYAFQTDAIAELQEEVEGVFYSFPDIGSDDAVAYYPALAMRLLAEALGHCGNQVSCVKSYLLSNYSFDQYGVFQDKNPLILKQFKNGSFIKAADG